MKFITCILLLSVIAGINCIPGAPDYKYTYGIGGKVGATYNGSGELGINAKDGTYSLFGKGFVDPSIYGDAGVFINPAKPVEAAKPMLPLPSEASNNPSSQQTQGRTQYPYNIPATAYNPYPLLPANELNNDIPQYNPYYLQMYNLYAAQGLPLYRPDYATLMFNLCMAQAGAQNGQLYGVQPPNTQQVEAGGMDSQTTRKPT